MKKLIGVKRVNDVMTKVAHGGLVVITNSLSIHNIYFLGNTLYLYLHERVTIVHFENE